MNPTSQHNVIYVLWSGGMDSTYLIQHLLDADQNNVIWSSYVDVYNNRQKAKIEKKAVKKMVPILRKKYGDRFHYTGASLKIDVNTVGDTLSLKQMPLWITSIIYSITVRVNQIAVGYVMNDDAISYLDDFRKIIKAYESISEREYPPVIFPLSKINKEYIIKTLDPQLRKHVVWCENPKRNGKACNICHSCKRHIDSIPTDAVTRDIIK